MEVLKNIEVPTGNILIVQGERAKLECVSLGDYGKENNIKADFLGLHREIKKIEHTALMPLDKKWVITVSSQYGCSSGCLFCDCPKVGPGINCSENDIINQVDTCLALHPEITHSCRVNIHYARMGEPTFNWNIFAATRRLIRKYHDNHHIHPVISTMMPKKNTQLKEFIQGWVAMKNNWLDGEAGIQFSVNSTDEKEREYIFGGSAHTIEEIALINKDLPLPKGRKYTLNFALSEFNIDASIIAQHFSPEKYMIKLTPMHKTITAEEKGIRTPGDYTTIYPYLETEENFKKYGFDVLVFLASVDEDMGRITCGNAILSGSTPGTKWRFVHI